MTTAEEVAAGIQTVEYPDDDEVQKDFTKLIRIKWDLGAGVNHLCVGTSDGNWNILSGDLGIMDQQVFDVSNLAENTLYVQRIFGDSGTAGPVIRIYRR